MLTPERAKGIADMIRAGAYAVVAARANGIGESTYHQWYKRGREAVWSDTGALADEADRPYVEFAEAVKEAEAVAEVLSVGSIRQAGATSWQAHAWYLERKYPDRWGRKDHLRQEVSGPGGGPIDQRVAVDAEAAVLSFLDGRAALLDGVEEPTGEV
jgi:hypothetical protein